MDIFSILLLMFVAIESATDTGAFCRQQKTDKAETSDTTAREIRIKNLNGSVEIKIGELDFTRYDYSTHKKPIFYPVLGPRQLPMTRNFPMKKVEGEANDHPHHKSMWIGHKINGVDFWSEKNGSVKLTKLMIDEPAGSLRAFHSWIDDKTQSLVVNDEVNIEFGFGDRIRYIDYTIKFTANENKVTFADTKEGFFAIRMHPQLRLFPDPNRGVEKVSGSAINDRGVTGKSVWGKKSKWVDYSGTIHGQPCGIAIFDHPENLRHPTTWHAREYGLVAANPFGLHHFQNKAKGLGEFVLAPRESIAFRYRVLFHLGAAKTANIPQHYRTFVAK